MWVAQNAMNMKITMDAKKLFLDWDMTASGICIWKNKQKNPKIYAEDIVLATGR